MNVAQFYAEVSTVLIIRTRSGEIKSLFVPEKGRGGIPPDVIVLATFPAASEYHEVF